MCLLYMIAVIINKFHWLDSSSVEVSVLKNEKGMYNGGLVVLQSRFHSLVAQWLGCSSVGTTEPPTIPRRFALYSNSVVKPNFNAVNGECCSVCLIHGVRLIQVSINNVMWGVKCHSNEQWKCLEYPKDYDDIRLH